MGGRRLDGQLPREHDLVDARPSGSARRRRRRSARSAPADGDRRSEVAALGCGSGGVSGAARSEPSRPATGPRESLGARAGVRHRARRSGSSVPRCAAIATSGQDGERGWQRRPDRLGAARRERRPSPVAQTGPGARRAARRARLRGDRGRARREHPAARSREAVRAPAHHLGGGADPGEGEAAVGLLPAEPAVGRQPRARRRSRVGSTASSSSTVAETSRPSLAPGTARSRTGRGAVRRRGRRSPSA